MAAIKLNKKKVCKLAISIFADMLGGDGWDNPKLPELIEEGYFRWPQSEFDPPLDINKEVNDLVYSGFDPRHLLPDDEQPKY